MVHGSAPDLGYVGFAFENAAPFEEACFRQFVERMPLRLYRLKGFAQVEDKYFFINHVGGKTEWVELAAPGCTRLAFVGWQVDPIEVHEQLLECIVK